MAINFPTSLDNFTNPSSGNTLDSPSHSLQHSDINDAVEAMQRKVGVGTAVAGSASAGQVLTISAAGTSTWSTPSAGGFIQLVPTSVTVSGAGSSASTSANGGVTFTTCATVSLNGIFSSTYENYRIIFTTSNFSASDALTMRLRASGTDASGANYSYSGTKNASNTATISALNASGQTSIALGSTNSGAGDRFGVVIDIFKPYKNFTNKVMHIVVAGQDGSGFYNRHQVGLVDGGTYIFDGLTMLMASGNMTGTINAYSYRD